MSRRLCRLLVFISALLAPALAGAHPPVPTVAEVKVARDGHVTVTLIHDSLAFALNDTSARIGDEQMYQLLDGPESDLAAAFDQGRDRFRTGFRLLADGHPVPFEIIESPSVEGVRQWKADNPGRRLPCKLDFVAKATLPPGTRSISLGFPEVLSEVVITLDRPGEEPIAMPLGAGELSPAIAVNLAGSAGRGTDQTGAWGVAWRFVKLGFNHIIPDGADHCLFVLGLFLLVPRIKPVLWQISAFTVAHTLTLTLTSLHIIGLPSSVVEPTVAASIAFIGVENLLTRSVHSWRIVVAFIFGLVHGMGVATAFNEAGFPPGQLVNSLAAFTVGVEAGHILVLLAAFALLGWTRDKPWYRKRIAIPLSLAIAAIAMVWFVQRVVAVA